MKLLAAAILSCLLSLTVQGQLLSNGDVLVAGGIRSGIFSQSPRILLFDPSGVLKATLYSGPGAAVQSVAVYANGTVVFSTLDQIFSIDSSGAVSPSIYPTEAKEYNSISVAQDGGIAVNTTFGSDMLRLAPDGSLLRRTPLPISQSVGSVDLAFDQCTAFYASQSGLWSINSCAGGVPVQVSPRAGGFRLTQSGQFVQANGADVAVLSTTGAVLRSFSLGTGTRPVGIALAREQNIAWVVDAATNTVRKIDFATGSVLGDTITTGLYSITAFAVVGEPRAALAAGADVAAVPALSIGGLVLLLIATSVVGLFVVRR